MPPVAWLEQHRRGSVSPPGRGAVNESTSLRATRSTVNGQMWRQVKFQVPTGTATSWRSCTSNCWTTPALGRSRPRTVYLPSAARVKLRVSAINDLAGAADDPDTHEPVSTTLASPLCGHGKD